MVTAQRNQLLADRTAGIHTLFAHLCVLDDTLHLMTRHTTTVRVSALARMHQRQNATLKMQKVTGSSTTRGLFI